MWQQTNNIKCLWISTDSANRRTSRNPHFSSNERGKKDRKSHSVCLFLNSISQLVCHIIHGLSEMSWTSHEAGKTRVRCEKRRLPVCQLLCNPHSSTAWSLFPLSIVSQAANQIFFLPACLNYLDKGLLVTFILQTYCYTRQDVCIKSEWVGLSHHLLFDCRHLFWKALCCEAMELNVMLWRLPSSSVLLAQHTHVTSPTDLYNHESIDFFHVYNPWQTILSKRQSHQQLY